MTAVVDQNEVFLGGTYFPIDGPVRPRLVSPFPAKVVIGDATRSDQILASQWIVSDFRGGIGVELLDERVHTDRYNWGVIESRDRNKLYLPPLAVKTTSPTNAVNCELLADFNGYVWAVFKTTEPMYRLYYYDNDIWNEVASAAQTLPPSGWTRYQGRLYLFYRSKYVFVNGDHSIGSRNIEALLGVSFDDKLVVIEPNGQLKWSLDPEAASPTWTDNAKVDVEYIGSQTRITSMVVHRNAADEPTIFVGTEQAGVYAVDFFYEKAYLTDLQFVNPDGGLGMAVWNDGNLYVPEGLAVHRVAQRSIAKVGLDRDDGPPKGLLAGRIAALVPTRDSLYALVDNTTATFVNPSNRWATADGTFTAQVVGGVTFSGGNYLLAFNAQGWHPLFASQPINERSQVALFSPRYGAHRVWFGAEGAVYYLGLPDKQTSPLKDEGSEYAATGYLETGWFDKGFPEIDGLAIKLRLRTIYTTATEKITVQYALDEETGWRDFPGGGGVVTQPGVTDLYFVDPSGPAHVEGEGLPFRSIRFRFNFERGDDPRRTPVLVFASLYFQKVPDATWGWGFRLNLTRPHRGKSPEELLEALKEIVSRKHLSQFRFRSNDGEVAAFVRPSGALGAEFTGLDERGTYEMQVVQVG